MREALQCGAYASTLLLGVCARHDLQLQVPNLLLPLGRAIVANSGAAATRPQNPDP
jgi:hypothetical protein